MKRQTRILIASIALFPCLAQAGVDITGTNFVPGNFTSASGYQNNVPGTACFVAGQANFIQGSYNGLFGYNSVVQPSAIANFASGGGHSVAGNFNTALGFLSTTSTSSVGSLVGGFTNTAGGRFSLLFGSFLKDGGKNGSVILSDSNPNNVRSAAAPFTNSAANSFSGIFNGGYSLRINDGQGANPSAGLFVIASGAQSKTESRRAFIGINTATPAAALDVVGGGGSILLPANTFFLQGSPVLVQSNGGFTAASISIRASDQILATYFIAQSDERIKNIQGRSDSAADLRKLLGIEITDYLYKDVVGKGHRSQKKVIAQQVEKVFPQAVSLTTDVVPDIYQKAAIKDGWMEVATDLKVGDRVRLITEEGAQDIHEVLEVKDGAFRTALQTESKQVFVYGREVKDFRTVDYEAIAMLNVSATQELARKVEASVLKLEAKEAEVAALKKQFAALQARDQAREARLARLEAAASTAPVRAVPAALELNASSR